MGDVVENMAAPNNKAKARWRFGQNRSSELTAASNAVGNALHDKHYLRKHGENAYYGQVRDTHKDKDKDKQ